MPTPQICVQRREKPQVALLASCRGRQFVRAPPAKRAELVISYAPREAGAPAQPKPARSSRLRGGIPSRRLGASARCIPTRMHLTAFCRTGIHLPRFCRPGEYTCRALLAPRMHLTRFFVRRNTPIARTRSTGGGRARTHRKRRAKGGARAREAQAESGGRTRSAGEKRHRVRKKGPNPQVRPLEGARSA